MQDEEWSPGSEVEIVTSRLRLRSLRPSDVPGDESPVWYGTPERRRHLWAPPMDAASYLRGLASAADNRRFFACLCLLAETMSPIGLVKGQTLQEGREVLLIPTTLIGSVEHEAVLLGSEATLAFLWFAATHLPVTAISMRVYETNHKMVASLRRSGYRHHGTYEEGSAQGRMLVHDYRWPMAKWLEQWASFCASWKVRNAR